MQTIRLLLFCLVGSTYCCPAQEKTSMIFRRQEQLTATNIHRFLAGDTLLETSAAKIHLHYSKKPGQPYLLLLHGMGANGRSNWYKQIADLSEQYNLLVPDLVYFGESKAKEDNFSAEFQAEQIHEAIAQLKIPGLKVNLAGFSYGGLVAALYNQLYHEQVGKLIIIDGPVKFFSARLADSVANAAGADNITNLIVPQTIHDFNAMKKAVISRKIPVTAKFKRKIIAHFFTPSLNARRKLIAYLVDHQQSYQSYDYRIGDTPTLLIWGKRDGAVPLLVGKALHEHFKETTTLVVFNKAKHDVHFRNAAKFNKTILNFLKN